MARDKSETAGHVNHHANTYSIYNVLLLALSFLLCHVVQCQRQNKLLYSRKYWRSIKFGGLAVGEATVKFKSVKFKCDLRVRVRAYYMYGTTTKFKSTDIFISAAQDQTAKFKDRQYFRLYGIVFSYFAQCAVGV